MGLVLLTERYQDKTCGMLQCFDRLIFQGVLPQLSYDGGITDYFYSREILIKDFADWAKSLNQAIRDNAERLAVAAGLQIQYLHSGVDKEKLVSEILRKRGGHNGLVCVLSVVERCSTYKPLWQSRACPRLRYDEGRCLHYYFYFVDEDLGLCFIRVPTWAPFRLEVYCNGHNWLACQLRRQPIQYTQVDNAFAWIEDPQRAQQLANGLLCGPRLCRKLEHLAQTYCPVGRALHMDFRWTIHQAEYSTDILFRRASDLQVLYEPLTRTVIHAVKARDLATFLGKRVRVDCAFDMGNRYDVRIEGTRIRHNMGPASIKMYDKFGHILRIESTINNVQFFPQYREVRQRCGQRVFKWTKMQKSIFSLPALAAAMQSANRRYLEFISALHLPVAGAQLLDRATRQIRQGERSYRGLNFFRAEDTALLETLARGEYNIQGFRNKDLRRHLPHLSTGRISRILKNLRLRGLLKKAGRHYKYYLTDLGKQVVAAGLYFKNMVLLPKLEAA